MTNHAEDYLKYIEGRHYTGPCLVDPELDDWVLVTNLGESYAIFNGKIECNPKRGLIRSANTGFIYSIYISGGYACVTLSYQRKRNKGKPIYVHTVVCSVVYGYKPRGLKQVNHKDFNKTNNTANNLEWCDNIYNSWYNKLKPKTYYVYTIDTLKKIREFPNYLAVLHYFNIKSFMVVTIESIKKYSSATGRGIVTVHGAFITQYDYGDVIDLPQPTKKLNRHAAAVYDKNLGITNVFSTVCACAKWLGIRSERLSEYFKTGKPIKKMQQYVISFVSWEEYYNFYDKQVSDPTIHLDLCSFNNKKPERANTESDEEQEQIFISEQLQKIAGIISMLKCSTMNQENSSKADTLSSELRMIAYNNTTTTQEDQQCPTTQIPLSLCA